MVYEHLGFVAIGMSLAGYFIGRRVRDITHMAMPFKEPVSLVILMIASLPWIMDMDLSGYGMWPTILECGFWTGYLLGYLTNTVDLLYIAVHRIVEMETDSDYIVTYRDNHGRLCWQPQTFWGSCRTVIFGIHNPLILNGVIARKRKLRVHKFGMPVIRMEVIDQADMQIHDSSSFEGEGYNPYIVKKGPFRFRIVEREYTPSPNMTDAPLLFYSRAEGYQQLFTQNAKLAMEAAESKAAVEQTAIQVALDIMNATTEDSPSEVFLNDLGADLRRRNLQAKNRLRHDMKQEADADA